MAKLTWIGDSDPDAQVVLIEGIAFVRGEATEVKDKDLFDELSNNPMFSKEAKPTVADVEEPTEDEQHAKAEEGTAKAALRRQLAERGITVKGNASEETLRAKLVEATKADAN